MSVSPFTFFRGSAAIMASDLAATPSVGLTVQLCGDAHLANFVLYGSPERNLLFDVNDFDETLPGPFEWDVKRLAASFTVAAQHRDFHPEAQRRLAETVTRSYRLAMQRFARKGWLPLRELPEAQTADQARVAVEQTFGSYRDSLPESTRWLVDRYRLEDVALKVVGVGSVGTRCWVALLLGRHHDDVLLLQVKEATDSVLERHLPASRFRLHGRRVVEGQRLMQAASDIFLGWSGPVADRHYYWRQLRDWKGAADLETGRVEGAERYAEVCGHTLARAHAVSGDPAAIAGYLGNGTSFDVAVAEFSLSYTTQNLTDYHAFAQAIADGLAVETES